jgi:putative flippase GtrA
VNISIQILRFGVVGTIGFCIDGGLLWLLLSYDVGYLAARLVSFPVAVCATWGLNRLFTFTGADRRRPVSQLNRYFGIQILGSLANFLIYAAILSVIEPTPVHALFALAIGAVAGLVVNYTGSRKFVFMQGKDPAEKTHPS